MELYEITAEEMGGNKVPLSVYKGKVLLVVNTATGCGFTPQYKGLQSLYEKFKSKGFEILDFPCNQFANQAPGTENEIHTFCTGRFGITFKQFAKIDVNGKNESPLYSFLKKKKGGVFGPGIKWNFTKFLIDRSGNVIKRFPPTVSPENLEKDIAALL